MRKRLKDCEIEFIKNNYSSKGNKYCSDYLLLNRSSVSSVARRLGLKVNKDLLQKGNEIINIDDYTNVTDPKISYILGLIWTDGCVSFASNKSKTPIVKHSCVEYDSESSNRIFKNLNWRSYVSDNKKSIGKNPMSCSWISSRQLGEYLISHNYRDKNMGTYI